MNAKWIVAAVISVAVAGVGTGALAAADDKDTGEVKVAILEVPAAVKATIEKAAKGGTIKEIEKETKDGKTIFEADVVIDGKEYEVTVAEDGKLISTKLDDDDDSDDKSETAK